MGATAGDLLLVMAGPAHKTRPQLSALRMELAEQLGLRKANEFAPSRLLIFLSWNGTKKPNYHAMPTHYGTQT